MIYGQITGKDQLIARFAALPGKVKAQADATVDRLGFQLQREVQRNYLTGQSLKVRTNRLRGSIARNHPETRSRVETSAAAVYAYVGTNVKYAAVHEYGFDGVVTVKAHSRNGHPVRSFQRHMRMPKRAYLAPAFAAFKPRIVDAFNKMLAAVVKDGLTR